MSPCKMLFNVCYTRTARAPIDVAGYEWRALVASCTGCRGWHSIMFYTRSMGEISGYLAYHGNGLRSRSRFVLQLWYVKRVIMLKVDLTPLNMFINVNTRGSISPEVYLRRHGVRHNNESGNVMIKISSSYHNVWSSVMCIDDAYNITNMFISPLPDSDICQEGGALLHEEHRVLFCFTK